VIGLFAGVLCYGLIGRSRFAIITATSSPRCWPPPRSRSAAAIPAYAKRRFLPVGAQRARRGVSAWM